MHVTYVYMSHVRVTYTCAHNIVSHFIISDLPITITSRIIILKHVILLK